MTLKSTLSRNEKRPLSKNEFATKVVRWFDLCGRKGLPWQIEPTPYRVWISEVMLQQTQVATVIPYFERFMNSFPDVKSLADAAIDDVLHHWSGLGYYARARNLHKSAQHIRDQFDNQFPSDFDDVLALAGVGRSTAGAILALSGNKRHAILDGNVKRVLARHNAIDGWPGKPAVADLLWNIAEAETPHNDVAKYTQAIMDLGATVCTGTKPRCSECPVAQSCEAHALGQELKFPGKRPKKAKPLKQKHMLLIQNGDEVYLERRPAAGIWGGLWSFPELDDASEISAWCDRVFGDDPAAIEKWETVRHSFTHFDLNIEPVVVRLSNGLSKVRDNGEEVWYNVHSPQQLGIAAPVNDLIEKLKEQNPYVPNG